MNILFSGFNGLLVGIFRFLGSWTLAWLNTRGMSTFQFDAKGEHGAFEKLLVIYLDILKFVLGLASGSIIILIGSSALRPSGHLPMSFASPLLLLGLCILYGILFMTFLTLDYEAHQHETRDYSRFQYTRNIGLGFGSLLCFCIGYAWLILVVTQP